MRQSPSPSPWPCLGPAVLLALLAVTHPAAATVSLSLGDNDTTPTGAVVAPGSTFTVTASLVSTGDSVTGLDYYLHASGAAAGRLRILDRNLAGSSFSDPLKADVGDNGANPGVEDSNFNLLAPRNSLDLGASVANVNSALGAGTHFLATYTILVPAGTPDGTYLLSTTADPGTGYVGAAPFFPESEFAQHGAFSLTVQAPVTNPVPEPAFLAPLALAALLFRRAR